MFFLLFFILFAFHPSHAEKNKYHSISSLCENSFLQNLYRKIDGAVLHSQNERNLDCVITFQTHSVLQRFMLRFDLLQLDCNDHLYVYDGAHAVGNAKADLSCRNTTQTVGAIFTRTNFVTLKYVTDNWGTASNGFKLVITAVKDPKHACKDFRCYMQEFCIATDLVCDQIDHCGDGSDEFVGPHCVSDEYRQILGMSLSYVITVLVCVLVILLVCIGACFCMGWLGLCHCPNRRSRQPDPNRSALAPQTTITPHYPIEMVEHGSNGISGTTIIPMSGNFRHPAG